jgi:hypothetical protein
MEKILLIINIVNLLIVGATAHSAHLDEDGNYAVCASQFYDFEAKGGTEAVFENWSAGNSIYGEYHYRTKTEEHLGAMLINEGFIGVPLGYGKFKIIKSGAMAIEAYCPSCGSKLTKLTGCAFNNCYIKISGQKKNDTIIIKPWKNIGDQLYVFNDSESLAEWRELIFECRRLTDVPPDDDF